MQICIASQEIITLSNSQNAQNTTRGEIVLNILRLKTLMQLSDFGIAIKQPICVSLFLITFAIDSYFQLFNI